MELNEAGLAEEVDLESPGVRRLLAYIDGLEARVAELEAMERRARGEFEDRNPGWTTARYILGEA